MSNIQFVRRSALIVTMLGTIAPASAWAQSHEAVDARARAVAAATEAAASAAEAAAEASAEPVDAQSDPTGLYCEGFEPGTWLINEDEAASDLATAETPLRREIKDDHGNLAYYAFSLSAPMNDLKIEARSNDNGDPALALYDETGTQLNSNDDVYSSLNAMIQTSLPAGRYCVALSEARAQRDVTLQVTQAAQEPLLDDGTIQCLPGSTKQAFADGDFGTLLDAGPIEQNTSLTRARYYSLSLASPQSFSLRGTGIEGVDPQIVLFDGYGNKIAENDDADGRNPRLDFETPLPKGEYCVAIAAAGSNGGNAILSAQRIDKEEYLFRAYSRGELPPIGGDYEIQPLRFGSKQSEVVLLGMQAKWFSFTLDKRAMISLRTSGVLSGADTKLALFDDSGNSILVVDDTDSSRDARITPQVFGEGTYYVALTEAGAQSGLGERLRPVVIMAERYFAEE